MRLTKAFIVISTLILFPMMVFSQQLPLSLEDLVPGGRNFYRYRPQLPRALAWNGDKLTYIKGDSMFTAPRTEREKVELCITLDQINEDLQLNDTDRLQNIQYTQWIGSGSDNLLVRTHDRSYIYDVKTKIRQAAFNVNRTMTNFDFAPSNNYVAYGKENNLYLQDAEGKEFSITNESNKDIVFGQSVHRNEFGINKGTFWSPDGNLLAFYRMDQTMVTDYPIVDISARIATLKNEKYPMAGMKSHQVTIGVYDPFLEQTIYLKTGTPKEKYLTNIAWSPDEKYIYVAEVNRGQDTCVVNRYDALTGALNKTLFTEVHPKYVEPQNPPLFFKRNATEFIWQSRRDGYNHLYLYSADGKLKKQLTSGNWDVTEVIGFDEKGTNLFYISMEASPVERHIYKLNLKSGKRIKLSKEQGVHAAMLSSSGKYISDSYSSQFVPGKTAITETKSNKTFVWNESEDPFRNKVLPEITLSSLKANDNKTDLYYRLTKPLNFDPTKKYPVIVYVYGGPHSQLVENKWMAAISGWDVYMAEKGYIVFTLDNRGTSNRGFDFENITHRQLGVVETQDQMQGIDFLRSLPYVNQDKIGVFGWSFGGFMTLNLVLRHPETFKVAVAGGPVTDWKYYEIMYGERYMDSPKENPEGYAESNMVARAGDLKGRLLIIHGDQDPTVVMQQSLQFLKSAMKKGTHPDFSIYPGHGHNMVGRDRVNMYERITRYFDDFLK